MKQGWEATEGSASQRKINGKVYTVFRQGGLWKISIDGERRFEDYEDEIDAQYGAESLSSRGI